ncbi:MAG: exonuclease SbcCD subunit D [Planctomycetota bacterium]|nr:MAG: exonuclease SbcCD subunit D [Planctomycetota bacterium]REK31625.1 MAG: exonuclease SbcCD subunit D [Planctomycetota bacterium]REK42373.1 MAG: exonuclease SbcCD subunit D [Planctomycetota bacterium]
MANADVPGADCLVTGVFMVRFLHTADWQLGMTRHFFSEGVQERYAQARFDAIRRIGQIARDEDCAFVLVCGDAFESNQVDRQTVARTCEALKDVPVPVYILPGNHDPLNAASVYSSSTFADQKPDHVHIIDDFSPREIVPGLELVGAPWKSKKPVVNPLEELLNELARSDGSTRIVMGHGIVDAFTPDKEAPAVISASALENAIQEGKAAFIALGDRHSVTRIGESGRVWYSGTPESTDFREDKSGYALVVELDGEQIVAKEVSVGQWGFVERKQIELNHAEDVERFNDWLQSVENKERTVLRLRLAGGLTLSLHAELQEKLLAASDLFAGFDIRFDDLVMIPEDADFADLGFSGFADKTVKRLREHIEAGGAEADEARDALMLLLRLTEGAA